MPIKYFNCPDGVRRQVSECLFNCQRTEGRCLSLPTLQTISKSRPWTGIPSTTQLINPTRMEYLKIKHYYAITPDDRAFALLGTRVHAKLDDAAKLNGDLISEESIGGENISGIVDLLVPNGNGGYELWDYKTSGSYKVEKAFNGEDLREWELQLNNYRILLESKGYDISRMVIQVIVRDGGTWIAKKRNITSNFALITIKRMDDDEVMDFFTSQAQALIDAVNNDTMPPLCDYDSRWGGRRCKSYCEVAPFCPEGAAVNKIPLES